MGQGWVNFRWEKRVNFNWEFQFIFSESRLKPHVGPIFY